MIRDKDCGLDIQKVSPVFSQSLEISLGSFLRKKKTIRAQDRRYTNGTGSKPTDGEFAGGITLLPVRQGSDGVKSVSALELRS